MAWTFNLFKAFLHGVKIRQEFHFAEGSALAEKARLYTSLAEALYSCIFIL